MSRILFIITSFIFLLNNVNAETFSAALKKAYNDNNELQSKETIKKPLYINTNV